VSTLSFGFGPRISPSAALTAEGLLFEMLAGVVGVEPTASELAVRRSLGAWNRRRTLPHSAELHARYSQRSHFTEFNLPLSRRNEIKVSLPISKLSDIKCAGREVADDD
jgi:hypothetical protein